MPCVVKKQQNKKESIVGVVKKQHCPLTASYKAPNVLKKTQEKEHLKRKCSEAIESKAHSEHPLGHYRASDNRLSRKNNRSSDTLGVNIVCQQRFVYNNYIAISD